ncbi:tetratricopeptide repeat protein [Yunchengibacter salinarum]|uniref:tetratricopeptide repeat protein n=1 Tax=Yunchengibacter salinarum TaxID=3133399 RepID=UPI0035B58981
MAELADRDESIAAFRAHAHGLKRRGAQEEAAAMFRDLVRLAPDRADLWRDYGDSLFTLPGRRGEASQAYAQALKLAPGDGKASDQLDALSDRPTLKGRREAPSTVPHGPASGAAPVMDPVARGAGEKDSLMAEARAQEARANWSAAAEAWRAVLDHDPDDSWVWCQYAHILSVHLHRFEAAEAAYRSAMEADPTDDWAWGKLGIMLADFLDRAGEGQALLREAIRLEPGEPFYHGWLGWSLYRQNEDIPAAESCFAEAVRLAPDYAWAWFHLGLVRYIRGDSPREALKALDRALALEGEDPAALFNKALIHEEQLGRPEKARRLLERAANLAPEDAGVRARLGMLFHGPLGDPAKAVHHYRAALERAPEDYDVMTRLGWLLWEETPHVADGIACLERAADLAGDDPWVLTHLAQGLFFGLGALDKAQQGEPAPDLDRAEGLLRQALVLDPDYEWAHACLGLVMAEGRGDLAAGEASLLRALDLNPDYIWARYQLGRVYLHGMADPDAALGQFIQVLEAVPGHTAALYEVVWLALFGLYRPDLAAGYAAELVTLEDDSAYAQALAGRVLRYLDGEGAEAGARLRQAVLLAPDDHFVWHEYGQWLLFHGQDREAAEEALLTARKLDPACGLAEADVGLLRWVQGDVVRAAAHFERSLEIDPDCGASWRAYGCFLMLSNHDQALAEQAFERAIDLEPRCFESWALMWALMDRQGANDRARAAKSRAHALAGDRLDVDDWLERSLSLRPPETVGR